MDVNKCFDCGTDNSVFEVGSFLCDGCREKEFARLRELAKGEKEMKTNREIVIELSKKGLKPKEISEKTGIPIKTVYNYRNSFKDEIKKESDSKGEVHFDNNDYEKLQDEIKTLKREIEQLQKENSGLVEQKRKEKINNNELRIQLKRYTDKIIHKENVIEGLRDRLFDTEVMLKEEKERHELLLRYVIKSNE